MAQPRNSNLTPEEEYLPLTARAFLNSLVRDGEIAIEPTEMSLSANHHTVKVTMVWEKLSKEEQKRLRQETRRQQTDNRRNGDYTKLKEQAWKHGKNPRRPNTDKQTTHAKNYSDLFTKEEKPKSPKMQSSNSQPDSLSYAALVKGLRDPTPLTGDTEGDHADSNPCQEVGKKKKPRNRRFKRRNKTVSAQTEKEETKTAALADQEENLPDMLASMLKCEDLQQ